MTFHVEAYPGRIGPTGLGLARRTIPFGGEPLFLRRTTVVSGPLAMAMGRFRAAELTEVGHEILTLPLLAARLAGGFAEPVGTCALHAAVGSALEQGGFSELEQVRSLPGMARAAAATLMAAWNADLDLKALGESSPRLADISLLDHRVREGILNPSLAPRDLRDAALANVRLASVVLGPVSIEALEIQPVWRPLIRKLCSQVQVTWRPLVDVGEEWFTGAIEPPPTPTAPRRVAETTADPRSEAVEALRWARSLMSRGVDACQIGIASTTTEPWDEHLLILSNEAGLPVHFTHGRPALDTQEGQRCAALADVLLHGLSQDRVRRLLSLLRGTKAGRGLPASLLRGLARGAGLQTVAHWERVLDTARMECSPGDVNPKELLSVLKLLAHGPGAAIEAGQRLLDGAAGAMWTEALLLAPAQALASTLAALSSADDHDPCSSVSWGPAAHLAAAPRAYVRLLGVNNGLWPRSEAEDPLLPDHVLPRRILRPVSVQELDRSAWRVIERSTVREVVLSRSRRSGSGATLLASPLWPDHANTRHLARTRVPEHAFSEADRLLSRPREATTVPQLASGHSAWANRNRDEFTAHDGMLSPGHVLIRDALAREQSSKSLAQLLRDPLGYVWKYALGWGVPPGPRPSLTLDPASFGELVHELLSRAVAELNVGPGLGAANPPQIESAVRVATAAVLATWPLRRALPPAVVWRHTVAAAVRLAEAALVMDGGLSVTTRSWVEVEFGEGVAGPPGLAFDSRAPTLNPGGVRFRGRMDRVDVRADGAARVTDYKTGDRPSPGRKPVLGEGRELQRVLYALALKQLLPDARQVVSRLVYLDATVPQAWALSGDELEEAISQAASHLHAATRLLLQRGLAPLGPDTGSEWDEFRIALPADLADYRRTKGRALAVVNSVLAPVWRLP